jgi:LysM repeat protein
MIFMVIFNALKFKQITRFFFTISFICLNVYIYSQSKSTSFEEYINKHKNLAIQHQEQFKIPASIILAQGLLESAAGDSYLAKRANNHFGIKCKENWKGGSVLYTDDAPNECFRKYNTVEDSYKDHSLFLTQRKYYTPLFDLNIYDYKGWAHGLQRCGYATDKAYGTKLVRIIETYELYKYDRVDITYLLKSTTVEDDIYEIKNKASKNKKENKKSPIYFRRQIYESNDIHYIVAQENDNYDKIAKDMRVSKSRLLNYNEIPVDMKINEGDIVYLQKKKKRAEQGYIGHIVSPGESIYNISQKYGIRLNNLYKINNLDDKYIPKPGDTLKLR